MKTTTFLFLFTGIFLAINSQSQAQDLILLTSGNEIPAKITDITTTEIWYKKPDSLQGRTFSLAKQDVFMLKYANGSKELIKPYQPTDTLATVTRTPQQLYELGRQDARQYYQGNGVVWEAAGATFLTGIIGTVLVGAIPPKLKPSDLPHPRLLEDAHYRSGYQAQAHRKKMRHAAAGGAIGTGALMVFVFTMLVYL